MIEKEVIDKVSSVHRFSGTHLLQAESIADHSLEMALLCSNFSELVPESNRTELCYRCVIHDLEEVLTTDIPRPIKHYSPEVKRAIDEAGKGMLAEATSEEFANEVFSAKDLNDINGYLVAVADRIQCFMKMRREVEVYGNNALKRDFEAFKVSVFDIIREVRENSLLSESSRNNLSSYLNKLIIN